MEDNPTLCREQVDRIRSVAQLRSVRSGEVLYEPSGSDVPLFVVLEGTVVISRASEDHPGIFAVGDTRAGSIKPVASAVGEGAMAVHLVHRFLAENTILHNGTLG